MADYFPSPDDSTEDQPPRLHFRRDLRQGEEAELANTARECFELFQEADRWMEERKQWVIVFLFFLFFDSATSRSKRSNGDDDDDDEEDPDPDALQADYLNAISPPVDEEEVVNRCELYLRKVEAMVECLQSTFSRSTESDLFP
jgi:hypothetical protein